MRNHVRLFRLLAASNIREVEVNARGVGTHGLRIARAGESIHIVAGKHRRMRNVVNVDRGHNSFHVDGVVHRTHLHFTVHRHGDV